VLGTLGLLPLVAVAVLPLAGGATITPLLIKAAVAYGAILLTFLAGVHGGTALQIASPWSRALHLVTSLIPAGLGWVALLLAPIPALCLLVAAHLLQALCDVTATDQGFLPRRYGSVALLFSAGAGLALLALVVLVLAQALPAPA
jgi:hypothetical protein